MSSGSCQINPFEADVGFGVSMKSEFTGKAALRAVKEAGITRKRIGFAIEGKRIARTGMGIFSGEERVGEVTSGTVRLRVPNLHLHEGVFDVTVAATSHDERDVYDWLAKRLGTAAPREAPPDEAASSRRAASNKRCRNARLRETGYRFTYPSFREGYLDIVRDFAAGS